MAMSTSVVMRRHDFMRLPDGGTLCWHEQGAGQQTCLLIHGLGDGSYSWDPFLALVSGSSRMISVDLRGHGLSSWRAAGDYGLDHYVDDVLALLRHLNVGPVTLIGHSLGGAVALRVAARSEAKAASLVIVDTHPEPDQALVDLIRAEVAKSLVPYDSLEHYCSVLRRSRPLAPLHVLRQIAAKALRPLPDGRFEQQLDRRILDMAGAACPEQVWDTLASLRCPVRLVRGVFSSILSDRVSTRALSMLRQGSTAAVARAGHNLMVDNANGFHAAVFDFIGGAATVRAVA
jgi:pimeloyl-ACP methyl ester carboxylesterase